MFLRISSAVLLAALAACSSKSGSSGAATQGAGQGTSQSGETAAMVACALAGAKTFTADCRVERSQTDGKTVLVLRHPDGGFRRLVEMDGGKSFAAADGSDDVAIEANGKEIEVTLGEDHYLFPAPGAGDAAPAKDANAAKP